MLYVIKIITSEVIMMNTKMRHLTPRGDNNDHDDGNHVLKVKFTCQHLWSLSMAYLRAAIWSPIDNLW